MAARPRRRGPAAACMSGASPSSAQPGESALELVGAVRWDELLHDWQTRSEHDGGYSLLRCRVCGTEVVR